MTDISEALACGHESSCKPGPASGFGFHWARWCAWCGWWVLVDDGCHRCLKQRSEARARRNVTG